METSRKLQPPKAFKAPGFARLKKVIDIILPPPGSLKDNQPKSWHAIRHLDEPCCDACGYPFAYNLGAKHLCPRCSVSRPIFDQARSAFQYDENSSALILAFKHGGRTVNLERFGAQMVRAGRVFWPDADLLIPVPLHRSRLRKRKYNQAALLAQTIARRTGLELDSESLIRHKDTRSQGAQTAKGRFRNVQGAFSVPQTRADTIKGKSIVLIDDVYTTGATLEACARTLRRAGVSQICALTLARVVKDQEIPT